MRFDKAERRLDLKQKYWRLVAFRDCYRTPQHRDFWEFDFVIPENPGLKDVLEAIRSIVEKLPSRANIPTYESELERVRSGEGKSDLPTTSLENKALSNVILKIRNWLEDEEGLFDELFTDISRRTRNRGNEEENR